MTHAIDDHNETAPSTAPGPADDLDRVARDLLGSMPRASAMAEDSEGGKNLTDARRAILRALDTSTKAADLARSLKDDDTIAQEGRDRLASEAIQAATSDTEHLLKQVDVLADLARARYTEDAKVKVSRGEALAARQDAQMLLDAAHERGTLEETVRTLAGRNDAVGGLVSSGWLGDYLAAKGVEGQLARNTRDLADRAALDAALTAGGQRARHAERALALGEGSALNKARDAARAAVWHRLTEHIPGRAH